MKSIATILAVLSIATACGTSIAEPAPVFDQLVASQQCNSLNDANLSCTYRVGEFLVIQMQHGHLEASRMGEGVKASFFIDFMCPCVKVFATDDNKLYKNQGDFVTTGYISLIDLNPYPDFESCKELMTKYDPSFCALKP